MLWPDTLYLASVSGPPRHDLHRKSRDESKLTPRDSAISCKPPLKVFTERTTCFISYIHGNQIDNTLKKSVSFAGNWSAVRIFKRYPKSYPLKRQLNNRVRMGGTCEWNDIHLILSNKTNPDVINSSPKYWTSIPSSSLRLKSIPEFFNNSMESGAYMSSLMSAKPSKGPTSSWIGSWIAMYSLPVNSLPRRIVLFPIVLYAAYRHYTSSFGSDNLIRSWSCLLVSLLFQGIQYPIFSSLLLSAVVTRFCSRQTTYHRNVWKLVDCLSKSSKLGIQVIRPYLPSATSLSDPSTRMKPFSTEHAIQQSIMLISPHSIMLLSRRNEGQSAHLMYPKVLLRVVWSHSVLSLWVYSAINAWKGWMLSSIATVNWFRYYFDPAHLTHDYDLCVIYQPYRSLSSLHRIACHTPSWWVHYTVHTPLSSSQAPSKKAGMKGKMGGLLSGGGSSSGGGGGKPAKISKVFASTSARTWWLTSGWLVWRVPEEEVSGCAWYDAFEHDHERRDQQESQRAIQQPGDLRECLSILQVRHPDGSERPNPNGKDYD